MVQLCSSALRIVAPHEEPASQGSSVQLPALSRGYSPEGGNGHTRRPAGSSRLDKNAAKSSRPTDRPISCPMAILAACSRIIYRYCYFSFELKLAKVTGAEGVSPTCLQTAEAILQVDALAALSRLLTADNRLPARAKLLPMTVFVALQRMASLLLAVPSVDHRVPVQQLLQPLACSHFLEHWAKGLVQRAGAQPAALVSSGRRSRGQGGSATGARADAEMEASLYAFEYVTDHLTIRTLHPGDEQPTACADAAGQQVLSGRCLQYLTAVRAVSDLYAAAGGPLYGLPYDALLPYLAADRQPGEWKGQVALSCGGLLSSIVLWGTCLDVCPLKALRPLRPRYLLALCLRTARVALASIEVPNTQGQQEHGQVGQATNMAVGRGLGGASSAVQLGVVMEALLDPMELRRRMEATKCPELAVAAMDLARGLVLARASGAGGAVGEAATEGGNGGGCERGAAACVGCSGSSCRGMGEGGDCDGGGGSVCPGQPVKEQPRAWAKPLLCDPSFADGWWRLALGIVRAALQQDTVPEQQEVGDEEKFVVDDPLVRCTSLLLPLDLEALDDCGGCKQSAGGSFARLWARWDWLSSRRVVCHRKC